MMNLQNQADFVRPTEGDRRQFMKRAVMLASGSLMTAGGPASGQFRQRNPRSTNDDETAGGLDEAQEISAGRLRFDNPKSQVWRIGLRLETRGIACGDVLATFPIPMPWPEQGIRVVQQEIDPRVDRWAVRNLPGGARQVVLTMPRVPAGSTPEVMFEFEVTRSRILGPETTYDLLVPTRPGSDLKVFLGTSPYIDIGDSRIRSLAKELGGGEDLEAWRLVESIYDWVRDHIEYVEGDIKPASQALRDGNGDCEEMTSLFVALCRLNSIPARMVWIPGHCYPEFYLEDADGIGTWFPCQAAGTRQFGGMDEYRPVLQKGDRFKLPEKRQPVRYIVEFFRCIAVGRRQPSPVFVREVIEG